MPRTQAPQIGSSAPVDELASGGVGPLPEAARTAAACDAPTDPAGWGHGAARRGSSAEDRPPSDGFVGRRKAHQPCATRLPVPPGGIQSPPKSRADTAPLYRGALLVVKDDLP